MSKVTKLDQKEYFIELRAKDVTYEEISKELGVSKPTLIKWGREFQMDIGNRRALELEYLHEKYFVSQKKRIEALGKQVTIINTELEKRDLSDISTEKLIDIKVKLLGILKQEESEIIFKKQGSLEDSLDDLISKSSYVEWKG